MPTANLEDLGDFAFPVESFDRHAVWPMAESPPVEVEGCADQREMGEGLREVPEVLTTVAELLAVEAEVVRVAEHLLEVVARLLEFTEA